MMGLFITPLVVLMHPREYFKMSQILRLFLDALKVNTRLFRK